MIVAIGLIGVFLSGFLLGVVFGHQRWYDPWDSRHASVPSEKWADIAYDSTGDVSNPEATIVTGDVPPTWTEDALR